ncbi:hypothetical protein GYMLUDRAFT_245413 [Collybiopsis luxurians FD-317 M1]|uniref:Uncharacterized protein n=1 Tax=Collybiopsis luxurians FD-317 M1 TaxID=944289 RepID=A0A0D0CU44_9AGAR|nr:hypothetical protein GYMLUDRAFT_245413 [Collybiopsis luxurians FD-317 M1]
MFLISVERNPTHYWLLLVTVSNGLGIFTALPGCILRILALIGHIKEAENSAADVAESIVDGDILATDNSFTGITLNLAACVSRPVLVFGLLGTVPYVGAGATAVYFACVAGAAAAEKASVDPLTPS